MKHVSLVRSLHSRRCQPTTNWSVQPMRFLQQESVSKPKKYGSVFIEHLMILKQQDTGAGIAELEKEKTACDVKLGKLDAAAVIKRTCTSFNLNVTRGSPFSLNASLILPLQSHMYCSSSKMTDLEERVREQDSIWSELASTMGSVVRITVISHSIDSLQPWGASVGQSYRGSGTKTT